MEERDELFERIEAYLNDTLGPDQRRAFEQQLSTDAALRREVELHRRLQSDYDPGRLELRAALRTVMEEPLPPDPPGPSARGAGWGRWLALLGLITLIAWSVWQWRRPAPEPPAATPTQTPAASRPDSLPIATPARPEKSPAPSQPIARADPARLEPNASLEAFVGAGLRSESAEVRMTRPANGLRVLPDANGGFSLRFSGTITLREDRAPAGFVLSFFDNRDANRPRLAVPLPTEPAAKGIQRFDLRQRLSFEPGLYYFTVEEKDVGEILYAGKFLVGN
jgi:anti-sigma factor RsiW